MRVLLKAKLDTEKANEAIRGGTMEKTMQSAMEMLRPEAAYFTAQDGCRTAIIVFDLADTSDIPRLTEPFMQDLGAKVEMSPVMNREDLARGLAARG
ncbi:hypothetical protein DWB77_01128 [Streptomyces hundungensis]|uniref:GYD domain-containing protein n=1 Tax=Streptomyces hundungensis TaxID=1077946 RepID=A0A387H6T6_9ACTN|nr:DUF3303 family protein [Streptomyces hundungensis]AYG79019.1 hypothetical protein DWB77_01128 [Streptomyces hundungensis]